MSKWLEDAIFYEIYPQSFQDSNDDGIGDINGIINRLDYIASMGFNAIWLNPCFTSPFGDAGYDVSDYYTVAPRYGTNADLQNLFTQAHKKGIHVILDLVPGHTSVEHSWFIESKKAEENQYSKRYIWTDSIWKDFTNVKNIAGCIRGISDRDGSCAVNFFSTQPALNYGFAKPTEKWQSSVNSSEALATREAIKDIMRFWLNLGCDGFRVDMAGSLIKGDDDSAETIKLWQDFRKFFDSEFPEAVLISEWGEPDKSLKGGFHMDFLLHFGPSHYNDLFRCKTPWFSKKREGNIFDFIFYYNENYTKINKLGKKQKGLICIPSGNHDMERLAKYLDVNEMKIAFAFLLSMPGCPFVYYGDEIGMRYIENLVSVEGGYSRTGSRSPMQWDESKNAGFSNAQPDKLYIKQDSIENRPTVSDQMNQNDSLLNEVKKLISLRHSNKALQANSEFVLLCPNIFDSYKKQYPLIFLRRTQSKKDMVLVVINPSRNNETTNVKIDVMQKNGLSEKKLMKVLYCQGEPTEISVIANASWVFNTPKESVTFLSTI